MTLNRRTFGLAAFAAGAALPAIGRAQPASGGLAIDEGMFVDINGVPQWITIRGRDLKNPVLLILHGGPGFPTSWMTPAFAAWEQDFTVVHWDQPGGGATYAKAQATGRDQGPLTVARYVADGLAVVDAVLAKLGKKKLVLFGNSWGTMLGVMLAQKRPDLVSAYVGTSQAVSGPEGGKLGYELALKASPRPGRREGGRRPLSGWVRRPTRPSRTSWSARPGPIRPARRPRPRRRRRRRRRRSCFPPRRPPAPAGSPRTSRRSIS